MREIRSGDEGLSSHCHSSRCIELECSLSSGCQFALVAGRLNSIMAMSSGQCSEVSGWHRRAVRLKLKARLSRWHHVDLDRECVDYSGY